MSVGQRKKGWREARETKTVREGRKKGRKEGQRERERLERTDGK